MKTILILLSMSVFAHVPCKQWFIQATDEGAIIVWTVLLVGYIIAFLIGKLTSKNQIK